MRTEILPPSEERSLVSCRWPWLSLTYGLGPLSDAEGPGPSVMYHLHLHPPWVHPAQTECTIPSQ